VRTNRECGGQKLQLPARPDHNKDYADRQQADGNRYRDLGSFLFVHSCFDGTEFRYFFSLVIVETRMDESKHAQN